MKTSTTFRVIRALSILLFAGVVAAVYSFLPTSDYTFGPEIVRLSGVIHLEEHYGPPNFGERPDIDKRMTIPMLLLDEPISITGDSTRSVGSGSYTDVRKVQLFEPPSLYLVSYANRHVTVWGKLIEQGVGTDFTEVLMFVKGIDDTI